MDSLPTEIWEHVAHFACSDNGFTGRALSLVCPEMHAIVEPYKLRSISIVGGPQIVKFSEYLASISTNNVAAPHTTIHNLFIGLTNPQLLPPLTTSSDLLLRSALNSLTILNDSTMPSPLTVGRQSLHIIVKAVHRILKVVAPTLHTLHLHFTFDSASTTFSFPFPMPQLSELAVYGPLLNPHTGGILSSTISLATIFPSLKRLRMGNFQGLPTDYLPRLAISMPQLKHISLFQPLPSTHHVYSLGRLIMSPEMFWSGKALKKIIIEVDVNSIILFDGKSRKPMQWLETLRDRVLKTADTRVRLIETHRSWVDVETAQIEWSKRNMGT